MADYYNYLRKQAREVLSNHFKIMEENIPKLFSQGAMNRFLNHNEHSVEHSEKISTTGSTKEPNILFKWLDEHKTTIQIRGLNKFDAELDFINSKVIWQFLDDKNGTANPKRVTLLIIAQLFNALSQSEFIKQRGKNKGKKELPDTGTNNNENITRKHWRFWINAAEGKSEIGQKIEVYNNALIEIPNNIQIIKNLAVAYDDAGRYAEAENYYLKGIELAPDDADIKSNYGLFLHKQGDYDQAELYFKRALGLAPLHINNNSHYAWFLHSTRLDYLEAEKQYRIALEINPQNIFSLLNYGLLLCFVKFKPKEGISLLERARELDPDGAAILGGLALAYTTYELDFPLAENYYKRATELDPTNPIKHANFAQLLFITGKHEDALKNVEIAKAYAGGNLEVLLEVEFYLYAHCFEIISVVEKNIRAMLKQGISAEKKNFSVNIKAGIKNGHPKPDTLIQFAKQISKFEYNKFGQMIFKEVAFMKD